MGTVYKILNRKNGRFYIGSSINIKRRWEGHKSQLRHQKHPNILLQTDWDKYKEESFSLEILEEVPNALLLEKEEEWITREKSLAKYGNYNISATPRSPMLGRQHTPETKAKISKATAGKNNPFYGKTHSKKTKEKIRQAGKKYEPTEDTKRRISASMKEISKGSDNTQAKLTEEEVLKIKISLELGVRPILLAKHFNVSKQTICDIKKGRKWTHVHIDQMEG